MKGWLDKYGKELNANEGSSSAQDNWVGEGYSNVGRNYSPAWGGQFAMGGSIPGSVGFTYARTGSTPSNGKYAKKTLPSAQNGMTFYQHGLDWKPRNISQNGDNIPSEDEWLNSKFYEGLSEIPTAYQYPGRIQNAEKRDAQMKNIFYTLMDQYKDPYLVERAMRAQNQSYGSDRLENEKLSNYFGYDYNDIQPENLQSYYQNYMKEAQPFLEQKKNGGWLDKYDVPQAQFGESILKGLGEFKDYIVSLFSDDPEPVVKKAPVEQGLSNEFLSQQAWKESQGDPNAVSPKGYKGLTQVGDDVIEDYKKKTGNVNVNPFNPSDAVKIQRYAMNNLYNADFINKPNQSNEVRLAKTLAAYNWGRGNFSNYLNKSKEQGVDIYNSLDWMTGLPPETSDYISKILLKKDKKFSESYKQAVKNPKYKKIFELYDINTKKDGGPVKAQYGLSSARDLANQNRSSSSDAQLASKMKADAQAALLNSRIKSASHESSIGQGKASTPESEEQRRRLNQQYSYTHPNAVIDNQGDLSRRNPDRSMEGVADPHTRAAGLDKGLAHMQGAIEAAGALEGLGYLGKAGYNALAQSMESGLLSKTYKINPWAWKPNPESAYRMIGGKEGYLDAINSGEFRAMENGVYGDAHYNMGLPLNPNRLNAQELIQAGSPGGYSGPYMVERKWAKDAWNKHTMTDAFKNSPEIQEELIKLGKDKDVWGKYGNVKVDDIAAKIYKEHWLKGYKEVPKPKFISSQPEITRGPINFWEEPGFAERNPNFNINSYNNSVNKFGNTSGDIPPDLMPYIDIPSKKQGGVVKDDNGYWNPNNWGKTVEIGSPDITMEGVNQPLLGISDEGDVQYMEPGKDYKFKGKKVTEYPIAQNGKATRSDSLALYNSQIALNKFYDNEMKAGRFKKPIINDISWMSDDYLRQQTKKTKQENIDFYRGEIKFRAGQEKRGAWDKEYKKFYGLSPSQVSALEYKGLGVSKAGNDHQMYYRDIITPNQNLAAPFAMIDDRIMPQYSVDYDPIGEVPGNLVNVYSYDPLAIKPADMRTPQEIIEWGKKYGKNKGNIIPTKKQQQKVKVSKDNRSEILKDIGLRPEPQPTLPRSKYAPTKREITPGQTQLIPASGQRPVLGDIPNLPYRVEYIGEDGKPTHSYFPSNKEGESFMNEIQNRPIGISGNVPGGSITGYYDIDRMKHKDTPKKKNGGWLDKYN